MSKGKKEDKLCPVCGGKVKDIKRTFCCKACSLTEAGKIIMKENYKKKMIELYGVDNPAKLKSTSEKRKKTMKERYGVEHFLQNKENSSKVAEKNRLNKDKMLKKYKETMIQKHGVESGFQLKSSIDNMRAKYGVENISQLESIKEKKRQTCIKHYGVDHNFKSPELRAIADITYRRNHWKTYWEILSQKNIDPQFEVDDYIEQNENSKIFKCRLCDNVFEISSHASRPQKVFCPNHVRNVSKMEIDLRNWVISQYSGLVENNKRFSSADKKIHFEIDIFIPEFNLGIEFNGLYWHSDIHKHPSYHYDKWKFFNDHHIKLIQVFENEWENKQSIVQSIILTNMKKCDHIIPARKCNISEISYRDYEMFCVENHIQGSCRASIRYGLFYEGLLVSLVSASKSRYTSKYTHEIIRSCTKKGYIVMGGFEKLFKHIITNHAEISSLISYVDNRYFTGSSYANVEMVCDHISPADFFYWNRSGFFGHRSLFQRHLLKEKLEMFDESKTAHENMISAGYFRIYDAGNKVFIWNRN